MTESAQADRGESVRPLVSAVMPCLNEELTLGICVDKALRAFRAMGVAGEVVVADNGSTDASVEVARAHGARVVHQLVKGYGAALQTGIDAAVGDFIIMGDADESYDWTAIAPFVEEWRKGADMVMGNRFRGGIKPDAMPALHRYLGNPVLSFISRLAFRVPLGDFHCGMRGFSKAAYEKMRPRTAGMEFATELIAGAARSGLKIVEIPVTLYPDKRNRPPHLRSFRRVAAPAVHRHVCAALPVPHPGGIDAGDGLILQALLATGPLQVGRTYLGIHYLALGGLLMLIGFNVLTMGVIAKLIVADRYPLALGGKMMALLRVFSLERALTLGGTLLLAGLAIAGFIFRLWLQRAGGSMDDTVHPAFVAGHLMVLGFNVMFFSFIFHLAISERDADGSWRP
ncbi:MAG: glycosyltransferase family 2 protein [Betaproteobacteria bacterium]|nr:glycosyltransferase family 2 protein [Betaproteobacteria bacterium]